METKGGPARAWPAFAAVLGEQQRLLRNMLSVPRVVDTALRTRVGTTARTVVLEEGTHSLLHYTRATPATQAEPVLLCYALVNRPYILDLQPDKSVVRQYLDRGFEVYMIDWGVPSHADRVLTLDNYVRGFLARAVDVIRRREIAARIQTALDALPPYHRGVILMREVEGMSYEEMAQAMGVSKGTIMSRLFHARQKLQRALADCYAEEGAARAPSDPEVS